MWNSFASRKIVVDDDDVAEKKVGGGGRMKNAQELTTIISSKTQLECVHIRLDTLQKYIKWLEFSNQHIAMRLRSTK